MWRVGLLRFCFKFYWAQQWKSTYFLMPVVLKKKKQDSTFGSVTSRGDEKHLGYSLLFWSRMLWTACLWLSVLKWIIHSIHYPLRKEIIVGCLGIYFLSYYNLEDSDSVYWTRKTQEKVLSVEKLFASVPMFYSEVLLIFLTYCAILLLSTTPILLKLCLLKYLVTSTCHTQWIPLRLWLALLSSICHRWTLCPFIHSRYLC